jgi:hypothetical protein
LTQHLSTLPSYTSYEHLDLKTTKSKPKPKKRIGQGTNKIKMIKKMKKKNLKKRVHHSVKDAINMSHKIFEK